MTLVSGNIRLSKHVLTPFEVYLLFTPTVLTAIFQVNLAKPVAPSVALTGRWGCHKVLQPIPHALISTTMAKGL